MQVQNEIYLNLNLITDWLVTGLMLFVVYVLMLIFGENSKTFMDKKKKHLIPEPTLALTNKI